MPGIRFPLMINGVPVVTTPGEVDVTTAGQLRLVLLRAAARGQATVVVDMSRTWLCDPAGLSALARAHRRALSEGDGLRLVLPPVGAAARVFAITRLDLVIPAFGGLEEALTRRPAAAAAARTGRCELVTEDGLDAPAAARPSGPVITLSGETGLTTPTRLRALICGQLPAGTAELMAGSRIPGWPVMAPGAPAVRSMP